MTTTSHKTPDDHIQTIAMMRGRLHTAGALTHREQVQQEEAIDALPHPVRDIVTELVFAGRHSVMMVHDSGDVLIWKSEADSEDDDGARALGRWTVEDLEHREMLSPLADY